MHQECFRSELIESALFEDLFELRVYVFPNLILFLPHQERLIARMNYPGLVNVEDPIIPHGH